MNCLECGRECEKKYMDWVCKTCGFQWHVLRKQPDRMAYLVYLNGPGSEDLFREIPRGTLAVFSWKEEM